MTPEEHLKAGDPRAALEALQAKIRADASNPKLRVFLFQLLCVLGDWNRAIAQLKAAAGLDEGATVMAQAYREAIICEVYREKVFAGEKSPLILGEPEEWLAHLIEAQKLLAQGNPKEAAELRAKAFEAAPASPGEINGKRFEWIADADMTLESWSMGIVRPVMEVHPHAWAFFVPFIMTAAVWLERAAQPLLQDNPVICPVPLHWTRLLKRKYNQSALLAEALAGRAGLEHCPDLLRRIRQTPALEGKTRDQRYQLLGSAICAHPGRLDRIRGRSVLIVDDVMTSGATLSACTDACLRAGAAEVRVAVLARVTQT